MCGINGFTWKDEALIRKMNETISHRGPDDTGIYVDDQISLGNNRLAIIDLSENGHQPMRSDDGALIIAYNGELYNFALLKEELKDSYQFKTKTDTEVILAAYKKWGPRCVEKFNGIFAFAIWDRRKQELFLARDHNGIKPLYYVETKGQLIFSSEIKAIFEHRVNRTLDLSAFAVYLRVQYSPEPLTMFKEVKKFPAATFAIFKNGALTFERYFEISFKPVLLSRREKIEALGSRVDDAVERQLISDRPLGLYLSGGIDSSIVLHTMSKFRKNIDTFSVGFELTEHEQEKKFNADFYLARMTAQHYGSKHHEVFVKPTDVVSYLERVIWHLDEPIANPTAIARFILAEFTKPTATVVLCGDGGDELFGGYERYRLSRAASVYRKYVPQRIREDLSRIPRLSKLNTAEGVDRFTLFMFQKDAVVKSITDNTFFTGPYAEEYFNRTFFSEKLSIPFERHLMDVDRRSWLVDESLIQTDKMSMAASVEARVPLLDKSLVEFAAGLDLSDTVTPFQTKRLLKDAYRGKLPDYLFREPKRGFFSPASKWLRNAEVNAYVRDILSKDYYSGTRDLLRWDDVIEMLRNHVEGRQYNLTMLWTLLVFQIWAQTFNVTA